MYPNEGQIWEIEGRLILLCKNSRGGWLRCISLKGNHPSGIPITCGWQCHDLPKGRELREKLLTEGKYIANLQAALTTLDNDSTSKT